MRISERVDNAVRAVAELAAGDGTPMKAEAISRRQDISLKYLLDILSDLKRTGLVRSKRGPRTPTISSRFSVSPRLTRRSGPCLPRDSTSC